MSELKAYNSERIYWAVEQVEQEAGDIDTLHLDDNLFYIKSEADKLIAELKAQKAQAEDDCAYWKTNAMQLYNELRHSKYKRCLAMARLCGKTVDHLNSEGYIYEKENHTKELTDCIRGTEFYDKWYHRWLELAEKFKEA